MYVRMYVCMYVCVLDMPWKHAQHFFLMSKRERCFWLQATHCDQVRKWVLGYGQYMYVCTWTLRGWGCPCLFRHKLYRHVLLSQRSGMYVVCIQGLALTLDMNLNLSSTGIESYWKILVLCTVCICSNALDISRWMDSARIKCYGGVCTVCRYGSCIYTFNNWHAAHHKKKQHVFILQTLWLYGRQHISYVSPSMYCEHVCTLVISICCS